jgi:hypothetical protein
VTTVTTLTPDLQTSPTRARVEGFANDPKGHHRHHHVVLRGGVTASIEALNIGWRLEARGFQLTAEDDRLYVHPYYRLTDDDLHDIRQHRDELLRLVQYAAPRCA